MYQHQAKQAVPLPGPNSIVKMDFELEIQKTNIGIRINIFEILWVQIVRQNEQFWLFRPKLAQKWILGSEFPNSKPGFGISTSNIPCVPIFRQNRQFFGLNLGKLPNYAQYFGSNIVEGVAESWMEAEMRWLEVGGAGWRLKWAGWRWMEVGGGESRYPKRN